MTWQSFGPQPEGKTCCEASLPDVVNFDPDDPRWGLSDIPARVEVGAVWECPRCGRRWKLNQRADDGRPPDPGMHTDTVRIYGPDDSSWNSDGRAWRWPWR